MRPASSIPRLPSLPQRLTTAALKGLILLYTGLVVSFFVLTLLGGESLWLVDALGYVAPLLFLPLLVWLPAALLRRSRLVLVTSAILAALFVVAYGALFLPRLPVKAAGPAFGLMTYNVLDLNTNFEGVAGQIEAHGADVIALHELEPAMARFLEVRLADQYPHRRVEPSVGLFSRYPIESYQAFRLGDTWAQQAVLSFDGRRLTLLNVHPRSPRLRYAHPFGPLLGIPVDFARQDRDADLAEVLERAARLPVPLLVVGDLNLSDRHPAYRQLMRRLKDVHREAGWGFGFTFTRYPALRLPTWRIDYILHSKDLVALRAWVGAFAGSDHRPVVARLAFAD